MVSMTRTIGAAFALATLLGAPAAAQDLVIRCGKVFSMSDAGEIFAPGMIWIEEGKVSYVGPPKACPEETPVVEYPDGWATPGLIDIHTHIHTGGWGDINDMVHRINPELRASAGMRPDNRLMRLACSAGVTTVHGIPGSGTNISGFGVLYKTKTSPSFEDAVVRDPGGMKVAQDSNPQARAGEERFGCSRAGMGWALEDICEKALAAERQGRFDPAIENLKKVLRRDLPAVIHTAGGDGVGNTARMWHNKYKTQCCVSHGSFDGWKVAEAIAEWGCPVNHGPRTMDWSSSRNGRINGSSAAYAEAGVPLFSLNTDSPVMPQEELFLQGAMSARLGADSYSMLKALTSNTAKTFGIFDRVGSLESGKDADIVIFSGDPLDPRSRVERVWIDGQTEYEYERGRQRF